MNDDAREITITRTFDAPRELVWKAWTDPARISQWWGPHGFEGAACEAELRVGGRFRLELRAANGNAYPCIGTYREIVEPERVVFAGIAEDGHPCGAGIPPRALVTVSFTERDGRTTLTLHTLFESAERKHAAGEAGYFPGWTQSLERLGYFLNKS